VSWYAYSDGEAALYRHPITVEHTSGGTKDIVITLANFADFDAFWNNVQTNGYDIRATGPDGRTLVTFDIASFSKTNKTGNVRIDGYSAPSGGPFVLWLYWGKPAGDATSVWGSPTIASAAVGILSRSDPMSAAHGLRVEEPPRVRSRATAPRTEIRKGVDEALRVFFLVEGLKRTRNAVSNGSDDWDGPSYVTHDVVDGNGLDVSSMYDALSGRYSVDERGRLWYSFIVKAGTASTSYTARILAYHHVDIGAVTAEKRRNSIGIRVADPLAS
jgi:hypothetical protein